jgi:hypothetical protein
MRSRRRMGFGYSPDIQESNIAAKLARGDCYVRIAGNETVCKYRENVVEKIRTANTVTKRKAILDQS